MNSTISLASIGDLCIDRYTTLNKDFLGGSAYNIAAVAKKAHADVSVFSAIGDDKNGQHFKNYFHANGIRTERLSEITGPTSTVDVTLSDNASPTYTNWNLGVLEQYNLTSQDENALLSFDIIRIMHLTPIAQLLKKLSTFNLPNTLKAADFDGETLYTGKTSVLDTHIKNLDMVIKSLDRDDTSEMEYIKSLAQKHPQKYFLVLLGEKGSSVYHNKKTFHQPSIRPTKPIVDTNGAGDNFIGTFLVTFKQTDDIQKAMFEGAKKASESLTHFGAVI